MKPLILTFLLAGFAHAASLLDVAQQERGVMQDTARQYEYMRVLDSRDFLTASATAGWCGAFAKWTLLKAGYQVPRSLDVHDWLAYGQPVAQPRPGDLVIFRNHVAFFLARAGFTGQILILGGAQSRSAGERSSVCQLWVDEGGALGYRRPVPAQPRSQRLVAGAPRSQGSI